MACTNTSVKLDDTFSDLMAAIKDVLIAIFGDV